ncbi:hypothetical protein [Pseudomonas sp. GV071]|jgi:hypothetical protein|uniref:hypothetical protein n=1 Tax=Pseudomonas sp. GV071 TaxID=2135754 RepID=UPI000D34E811|nr:hypothetical protein [Pseudomonas sp. GV071]PTQ70653.1 hypothetical protein C8K61_106381 [Pseudomonas sp. GV071]
MDALPIALFWGLALFGLFGRAHVLLYLFFGSIPFGAFAVIPPEITGGLTLTPTPMVVLLIILRSVASPGGLEFFAGAAFSPKRLFLLFMFWLVAIFVTIFMPRLFMGKITIIPVRLELSTFGEPLMPTSQNFSQLAYLSISVFAVFAFTRLLRSPEMRKHALNAMCLGGAMAVLTGFLDYMSQYVGMDAVLSPFRTASYALMTEVQIMGGKRIVGLMPEASVFGGRCIMFLSLLYFFRHAIPERWLRKRVVPVLIPLLILFVWLSTSSAGYVGLLVFFLAAVIEWAIRKSQRRADLLSPKGLGLEFWVAWTALVGVGVVVLFAPGLLDPIIEKINEMVLNKSQTSSYEERSMWTAVGWQALIDSYGLGVGIGATRVSNSLVAILSNTGVLGGVLYFAFALQTLMRKLPVHASGLSRALMTGCRYSYIPAFIVGLLTSTTPDFGSFNSFLYGLALAVIITTPKKLPQPEAPKVFRVIQPPMHHPFGDVPR